MKDLHSHASKDEDRFIARRDAIDRVATLRARAIRVALFARMIHYPGSDAPSQTWERDALADVLREQVAAMRHVCDDLLNGGSDPEAEWLTRIAAPMHRERGTIEELVKVSEALADAVDRRPEQVPALLVKHFALGRGGFFEAVTSVCNAFWCDIDRERAETLERTQSDAMAISRTLAQMGKIGKHVRLVALNASVEAARAGDSGKGIAVIAAEFKALAEEIQRLAAVAEAHNGA